MVDMAVSAIASGDVQRLLAIMARLRDPNSGCPWDVAQSFATIAPYTIEEAYEVADAIARGNLPDLKDELGDLLLQVVYHARMAQEQGAFAFADVVEAVTSKMIRRHPHVFGTEAERAAGVTAGFWDRAKDAEKADEPRGVLDDVPTALPALTRAIKLQNKAAKVGFDWPSLEPVFEKLNEEIAELEAAIVESKDKPDRAAIEEEFGDLLFVIANVARHLKLDPEAALRAANEKFSRRFRYIEAQLAARGSSPVQSDLAEMDALWDEAKANGH
jgi:MazG family protein